MITRLQDAGRASLDLFHPDYRDSDKSEFPLDGLRHPLSQALFCLFPGQFSAWYVEWEDEDGGHVFLRDAAGSVVDLVSYPDLSCDDEDYAAAEPVCWRPRRPTQRTLTLLARAGFALPAARSARVRRGHRPRRRAGARRHDM